MLLDEIVLPETKPETEWVRGRPLQKVSPKRDHSRIQGRFGAALEAWAQGRGEWGPEWRFRVAPPGEPRRPLVPDLAFVSYERLRGHDLEAIQAPAFAPDVAIEILSKGDRRLDIADKIAVYLSAGTLLVIVVDPARRTVALHDPERATLLCEQDTLVHPALPEFALDLTTLFAALDFTPPAGR
jgi:Uma2 family endonuclease